MTTVVAAVMEQDQKVLVCQRKADGPHPLKWEFPGGKVEAGESLRAALRRELHEELGVEAEIGGELARYEYAYAGKGAILLVFYSVRGFTGVPKNHVFAQMAWVERGGLRGYDFLEGDVEFLRLLTEAGERAE